MWDHGLARLLLVDGRAVDVVGRLAATPHRDGAEREVREVALRKLGGMPGADVEVLERALNDDDRRIREAAADGLGAAGVRTRGAE